MADVSKELEAGLPGRPRLQIWRRAGRGHSGVSEKSDKRLCQGYSERQKADRTNDQ